MDPTYVYGYANARGVVLHLFAGRAGAGGTLVTVCGKRFVGWGTDTVPSHGRICKSCAKKKG